MARYLYSELASLVQARRNSAQNLAKQPAATNSGHWLDKHTETIQILVRDHMPSGSGFDCGTKIDLDASHAEKLVFTTEFHHMDGNGYYDGWTEHTVTVTPSLTGNFNLRISGRNRNDIKDYMHECFDCALRMDVTYDLYQEHFPELKLRHAWENEDGSPSQCYQCWYVGEKRFWNDYSAAREYAGQQMYSRWMAPKSN